MAIAAALAAKAARGPDWGSDKTSGLSTGDSDGIERRGDRGRERRRATLKGGGDRGLHTCEDVMASLSSLPCPYFELPLGAIMNRFGFFQFFAPIFSLLTYMQQRGRHAREQTDPIDCGFFNGKCFQIVGRGVGGRYFSPVCVRQ